VESWFSTGCAVLDLAIADKLPGGFPAGRITHIYGDPSTTKSVLALEPLGAAQRKGGRAYLVDVECSLDFDWAELNGVKIFEFKDDESEPTIRKDFEIFNPNTIEQTFDEIIPQIVKEIDKDNLENKCAVSIDSLTALNANVDLEMELSEKTYGGDRAKQFGRGYRKVLRDVYDKGLAVIVIDQLRDDMRTGAKRYGGGRAIGYYSDVQILLELTGEKIRNERGTIVGIEVEFMIKKNKVATPFREGKFRFLFNEGIDDIGSSLQWLKENKSIAPAELEVMREKLIEKYTKSGLYGTKGKLNKKVETELKAQIKALGSRQWYEFCGIKKQKLSEMIEFIQRKNLEGRLRKEVLKMWHIIYAEPKVQKEKVRF